MTKLADALEGGHSGWRGVPYVRIDGDTDSRERLEVLQRNPAIFRCKVTSGCSRPTNKLVPDRDGCLR